MRILVEFEVESREELAAVLKSGREHTLYDARVAKFIVNPTQPHELGNGQKTAANNAIVPCPKHSFNTDCKLTPAWICKKHPCKIDRAQHP